MTVTKEGVLEENPVTPEDLAAISQFSRKPLTAEEVYTFALRLCDNQTDRDGEYFDREGLETLAELFVGKTGIFDHIWSAKDQTARLYRAQVVEEPGVITEAGEPGCYLKGWAYLLRTPDNASLIQEIEGGIKKEVSVGCAVAEQVCSICGHDIRDRGLCCHRKGEIYDGQRCMVKLAHPTDAYEWSFVAVPAQPKAGVVKSYGGTLRQVLAQADRTGAWREELRALEKEAALGRRYLETLRGETIRLGLLAEDTLGRDLLTAITDRLEGEELEALRQHYAQRAEKRLHLPVQLRYSREETETGGDDLAFRI
jgi:hypothetical protein